MFTDTKLCSLNGVAHPLTHIFCSLSSHSFFCSIEEEWNHYYNIETDFMRKPIHFCRLNKMSSVYLLRHICIIYSLDERKHTQRERSVITSYECIFIRWETFKILFSFSSPSSFRITCMLFYIEIEMHAERVNRIRKKRIRRVHFGQLNWDQLHYCA